MIKVPVGSYRALSKRLYEPGASLPWTDSIAATPYKNPYLISNTSIRPSQPPPRIPQRNLPSVYSNKPSKEKASQSSRLRCRLRPMPRHQSHTQRPRSQPQRQKIPRLTWRFNVGIYHLSHRLTPESNAQFPLAIAKLKLFVKAEVGGDLVRTQFDPDANRMAWEK